MNRSSVPAWLALIIAVSTAVYLIVQKTNEKKFVFVDMIEVYNGFEFKKVREQTLQAENNRLIRRVDTLNGVLVSSGFSPLQKEYAQYEKDSLIHYFSELSSQYEGEVLEQLNKYVGDYGREHHCMMVFGGQGNGSFMYVDSSLNVTPDVIQYVNEKYAGKP